MNAYNLIAFTSSGYCCNNSFYNTRTEAIKAGRELKKLGYAFSYKVYYRGMGKSATLVAQG